MYHLQPWRCIPVPTNTEIVHGVHDAFVRRDLPGLLALCDDNAEMFAAGDRSVLPYAGAWKGKSGIAEYFRRMAELFDVPKWDLQQTVASGDRVVTFGIM